MLPHSELDNYKLQVELLQEKLQRSEENRKKLEHKLEHAIQRKSEHEKILRAKQRQKYQDFLGDLERRNERNRQLMKMLERIDQQTTTLSARSERVRMMKMQYEMYFAKLVQSQTMRYIHGAVPTAATTATAFVPATPTPIPVLLPTVPPTQQTTAMTATPIKNNESEVLMSSALAQPTNTQPPNSAAIYQCNSSSNLISAGTIPTNVAYAQGAPDCNTITATTTPQHWTLAMATPTPAGMLLTTAPTRTVIPVPAATATDYVATAPNFDYMQYPLGYLPRMRQLLQQQQQPQPHMPIYSDESDDLLQPMNIETKSERHQRTNKHNDDGNIHSGWAAGNDVEEFRNSNGMDLPTRHAEKDKNFEEVRSPATETAPATTLQILRKDNQHQQRLEQGQKQKEERPEQLLSSVSTTSSASSPLTLDKLPKTMTMTEHENAVASTSIDDRNNDADDGIVIGDKPQSATRFDEFSKGISIGCENKGALQVRSSDEEKPLPSATSTTAARTAMAMAANANDIAPVVTGAAIISNDNGNTIETNLRQKIDTSKPWQEQQQQQQMTQSWHREEGGVGSESTLGGKDSALRFEQMTGGFAKFTENKVTNNDLKSVDDTPKAIENNVTTTKAAIEKIENEIYGELVNPSIDELEKNDARNAAHGLVTELVTQQQQQLQPEIQQTYVENVSEYVDDPSSSSAIYEQSTSESYDPAYATIEGTTNAEVYPTVEGNETAYTTDPNMDNNYAQYAADPNTVQSQQDYSNIDYANYDATQYTTADGYNPNVYPGYTYDETTGQYTADPTASYDTQNVYDQQQYDITQQDPNYDYTNYSQPETTTAVENVDFVEPPAEATPEIPIANVEPTSTTFATSKPTSILSTGDKHSAANEAQKKKKRVNFVDSSETDDSSSVKPIAPGSESDFDFSSSEKSAT